MRKYCLFFAIILSINVFSIDIFEAFRAIPDSLLVQLNPEQKLELLDNYFSVNTVTENRYKGKIYVDSINIQSNFLQLKTTHISTIQIKLIPKENDTIIGVISTICDDFCDSNLQFFSKTWQPVLIPINLPTKNDFFYLEQMNDDEKRSLQTTNFLPLYKFSFVEEGLEIQFSGFDSFDFFEQEKLRDFLRHLTIRL